MAPCPPLETVDWQTYFQAGQGAAATPNSTFGGTSQDDADVLVTILDRRIEVNESGTNDWGGSLSQTHYQSRYIVFFRFESGATIEEFEIALAGAFVTWKRVAGVLAKDAEAWARKERR